MTKHLSIKAFFLVVVMFFHSFVLVPRANATTWEAIAGRLAYRAVAPSVIAAMGSGTALVIGAAVAGGIGYLIYKSGAIDALKTWWNSNVGAQDLPGVWSGTMNGSEIVITGSGDPNRYNGYVDGQMRVSNGEWSAILEMIWFATNGTGHIPGQSAPSVPTDYVNPLATTQPSFPSNTVKATPGTAAAIAGGAAILSTATMSDSDADRFAAGSGATSVSSDGTQAGNPSVTDNTVTAGDAASMGMLQQIMNFVSNLVGIKTGVESVKTSVDNMAVGILNQTAVMDNVGTGIGALRTTMDNVGVAIQNQTAILDGVAQDIDHMDNTLSGISNSTATESTLSSRLSEVQSLLLTKFPFSVIGVVVDPGTISGGTYEIPDLVFPLGVVIPVDPMKYPQMATFVGFIRGLMAVGMWAMFVLIMIRRVTQI